MKEGWKKFKLGEFIEFNPKETLKKGTVAKYIEMSNLQCFFRNILGYEEKEYRGGTKFKNGDTLLARITPCLENGKTAYVNGLEDNEIAFGSTEYIILREKMNISDSRFIYYLAISNEFRDLAIKSMTGTSGRQRVQTDMLISSEIHLPPLSEQKEIASILSSLDDKIELNNEMNKTLEEMSQTLFKQWFIDFEFPNERGEPYKSSGGKMVESELGEIPEGWEVGALGDYIKIQNGYAFKGKDFLSDGKIRILKIKNINSKKIDILNTDFVSDKIIIDSKFKIQSGDILVAMTGAEIGKIGIVPKNNSLLYLNQRVGKLCCKEKIGLYYSYVFLQNDEGQNLIKNKASGSAQPNISSSEIEAIKIIVPDSTIILNFEKIVASFLGKVIENMGEIMKLNEKRDTILPKLMSGSIEVTE